MGLFDFIKPKSAIEKAAKAVREPYSQPEYRREAMTKLFEIGTEQAYDAVLQRFTFNAHGAIADESEKTELVEELVRIGRPTVPSLKRFIETEKNVAFPIRALARILEKEELVEFLVSALHKYPPLDHRSTQAKASLLIALHEHGAASQAEAVVPYLRDHHDDVQIQAIVVLEKFRHEGVRPALVELCVGDVCSARIRGRAAQALVELEWPVKDDYERMHSDIRSEFVLSKKGTLVRKHQAAVST